MADPSVAEIILSIVDAVHHDCSTPASALSDRDTQARARMLVARSGSILALLKRRMTPDECQTEDVLITRYATRSIRRDRHELMRHHSVEDAVNSEGGNSAGFLRAATELWFFTFVSYLLPLLSVLHLTFHVSLGSIRTAPSTHIALSTQLNRQVHRHSLISYHRRRYTRRHLPAGEILLETAFHRPNELRLPCPKCAPQNTQLPIILSRRLVSTAIATARDVHTMALRVHRLGPQRTQRHLRLSRSGGRPCRARATALDADRTRFYLSTWRWCRNFILDVSGSSTYTFKARCCIIKFLCLLWAI